MHGSAQAWMCGDGGPDFVGSAAIVDRHRQVEVDREREQFIKASLLDLPRRPIRVHEVEADLADRHGALVGCEQAQLSDVRRLRFRRVMPDAGEHFRKLVSEGECSAAVLDVDAHRDHARDSGGYRRLHHLAGVAQLLEMEMRVYEDAGDSPSTTSSSRLKRASGAGSTVPAASFEGSQRSMLS